MGFLPGLGGVFSPLPTLVLFASSTSSSSTITVPASVADGDVAVLIDRAGNAVGIPSSVTPSGYTLRANVPGPNFIRVTVLTKLLTSGDAGATVTGMNGSFDRKVMLVFRQSPVVGSIAASTVTSATSGSSNPSAASASYTGVAGSSVTLGVLACSSSDSISGASFSPSATGSVSSETHLTAYYLLTTAGDPGSCSVDQGDSGGAEHINVLLNLALS